MTTHSEGQVHGSEFVLALRLAKIDSPTELRQFHRLPPRRLILVVDDEADVADTFASLLNTLGQDVMVAFSGEEVLQAALEYRRKVALLDLSMPEMGGSGSSRLLRGRFPDQNLTLVALPGHTAGAAVGQGGKFQYHLLKPVDAEKALELLIETGALRPNEWVRSRHGILHGASDRFDRW